jgi:Na+/melibiose symporter-like transporter
LKKAEASPVSSLDDGRFSSPEYQRSRAVYMAQCTFEYLLSLLVTDAFLTKLLTHLGIDDATIGIISSFISLAFAIQIFALFLYKLRLDSKATTLLFYPLSRLIFSSLYIIPFLPIGGTTVKILIMCLILVAYSCKYLALNVLYKWANSYVSPHKRASYSATKEMISLASGIVFTAAVGYVFDEMEARGNIEGGFVMLAVLAFLISALDVICLIFIKREDRVAEARKPKNFKDIMKNTLGNKNYRSVLVFFIVYNVATHFNSGFLGTFKVKELAMSVFIIQLVNIIGNLTRITVSKPFGRFSDKRSFASGMAVALCITAVAYLFLTFTTRSTWYFIIIYSILHAAAVAGLNQNSFNIAYSYVDKEYVTEALAIKNCIGGICGFLTTILSSRILKYIQGNGNSIFGIPLYAQQFLAFLSFVVILIAIAIMVFVVGRQKVMKQ